MSEAMSLPSTGHNQPPAVPEFEEFERLLRELRETYADATYDLGDHQQERQARSDQRKLGVAIADLKRKHEEVKGPLLAQTKVIDGEHRRIRDELRDLQSGIKDQIAEKEQREADRVAALDARVQGIRDIVTLVREQSSVALSAALDAARAVDLDDGYDEKKAEAALAKTEVVDTLGRLLADAQKREAEAAELERLRREQEARERKERDERIAREAEERTRREAEEQAAKERKAAERREAEAVARERERIERERAEAERKAEKARLAEEKKKARREHRAKIHAEATDSLVAAYDNNRDDGPELDRDVAVRIVSLIKDGAVQRVSIEY